MDNDWLAILLTSFLIDGMFLKSHPSPSPFFFILSVNTDLCDLVIQQGAAKRLVACFQSRNCECQRMAAMALSNLSSNLKSHSALLELDILSLIKTECLASLDPKRFSDHETARFCVLIISNMTGGKQNHGQMDSFFGK